MKTFRQYADERKNESLMGLASAPLSAAVGGALGLGAGALDTVRKKGSLRDKFFNILTRMGRGAKNYALSTATDGKYGDHDEKGNPKFMKK